MVPKQRMHSLMTDCTPHAAFWSSHLCYSYCGPKLCARIMKGEFFSLNNQKTPIPESSSVSFLIIFVSFVYDLYSHSWFFSCCFLHSGHDISRAIRLTTARRFGARYIGHLMLFLLGLREGKELYIADQNGGSEEYFIFFSCLQTIFCRV